MTVPATPPLGVELDDDYGHDPAVWRYPPNGIPAFGRTELWLYPGGKGEPALVWDRSDPQRFTDPDALERHAEILLAVAGWLRHARAKDGTQTAMELEAS